MKAKSILAAIASVVALATASGACAQATRTWVSGVGDDANPCSRTAPCKTFAGAISKTAASGEIDVLDPGGFGAVTITKAITIASEGAGEGGVLVSGTNGVTVSAGANDVVVLRGLQFEGAGTGLNAVKFNSGKALVIENSTMRGFNASGATNGFGINFAPSSGSTSLLVRETSILKNGTPPAAAASSSRPPARRRPT